MGQTPREFCQNDQYGARCCFQVPGSLFNAASASPIRRSRACCNVERDSLMRPMAILSGAVLKFPMV